MTNNNTNTISLRVALALLLFIVASIGTANAQTIKGKVIDSRTHEAIIGAIVSLGDGTGGTSTDLDGHFALNTTSFPSTLNITYTGYKDSKI